MSNFEEEVKEYFGWRRAIIEQTQSSKRGREFRRCVPKSPHEVESMANFLNIWFANLPGFDLRSGGLVPNFRIKKNMLASF